VNPISSKTATALRRLARGLYGNNIGQHRSYAQRRYQVQTALDAVAHLSAGHNVAIELPTGVGKTLIACLAAVFWKRICPGSRTLLIVPSRTLVVQHFEVARWVAPVIRIDRLGDDQSSNPGSLRWSLMQAEFIVSTPGILASALRRGVVDQAVIDSFRLVIVDEFDQFVVVDESERESIARYAENWNKLQTRLPSTTRYIVKSATLGMAESHHTPRQCLTRGRLHAALVGEMMKPVIILVDESEFAPFVPRQAIIEVRLHDRRVEELLEGISNAKGRAHLLLDEALKLGTLDYADVERRASQLGGAAIGSRIRLRLAHRSWLEVSITKAVRQQFRTITGFQMLPQHIFEDLTEGFETRVGDCEVKTSLNQRYYLEQVPILVDTRRDNHVRFQAGGKTDATLRIVAIRAARGQRGVLFVRTITLLAALRDALEPLSLPLIELTGEKSDDERRLAISRFRATAGAVLLMTRTTGGRGLDLPFADYAIFYSPKSEPATMWQEISRIRSTVSATKDTYVLCYGEHEGSTLAETIFAFKGEGRQVQHLQINLADVANS
jgi:hypothetical protein